jgi:hypothetical protein
MGDQAVPGSGFGGFAHRVLDRLTAMKLRVGTLRARLRLGVVAPEEVERHLAAIDEEIDATASLAQDVQASESGLSSA